MTNVKDYSKPFDESFLDFVKNHNDVVLTQEKFQELLKKIDELEKNLAGTEQTVQEGLEINEELKVENEKLRKQVTIAMNALKWYAKPDDDDASFAKKTIELVKWLDEEALKQIKELEK